MVERQFSEKEPELMDLPNRDSEDLRRELKSLGWLNRVFGARKVLEHTFKELAGTSGHITLIDLASGFGDHGRNLTQQARKRGQQVTVISLDHQLLTLQIAREATPADQKAFFVQADIRQLPFRAKSVDLASCTLALHHFTERDARAILTGMERVARRAAICLDLARSRLAIWCIDFLAKFIMREAIVKHDASLSIRRAFDTTELKVMAQTSQWNRPEQTRYLWFQQAVVGTFSDTESKQ